MYKLTGKGKELTYGEWLKAGGCCTSNHCFLRPDEPLGSAPASEQRMMARYAFKHLERYDLAVIQVPNYVLTEQAKQLTYWQWMKMGGCYANDYYPNDMCLGQMNQETQYRFAGFAHRYFDGYAVAKMNGEKL